MSDLLFSPASRDVFPYFDGTRHRYGDPLAIHRRLTRELEGRPNYYLDQLHDEEDYVRFSAEEKVVKATRSAFELVPFDPETGTGALDIDAQVALDSYLEWLEKKEPRAESYPTSSEPTARPYSTLPIPVAPSPMRIGSAFGSTPPDCGCSEPGP